MSVSMPAAEIDVLAPGAMLYCRVLPPEVPTHAAVLASRIGFTDCGAVLTFEGVVRLSEGNGSLRGLEYEFHPIMAETELRRVCNAAMAEFRIIQLACEHRTGFVPIETASVAIAIGSMHRREAFEACQYVLDHLKKSVPIWKTPIYSDSTTRSIG